MLALCLERLGDARGLPPVSIYADTSANLDEIEWVRDTYLPTADIHHAKPHLEVPSGCWNILNSIKQGYLTGADRVYLVEEDVMVRPNFFEWHNSIGDEFLASCGRKDPAFYPRYPGLYTNPGSCLHRDLLDAVVPHINDDYFRRLRDYMDEKLPPKWDEHSNLDDGLIRRTIRNMQGKCAYPETPVAVHQGFHFYRKVDRFVNEGTIEERVEGLRKMLARIKPMERYAHDLEHF
jgi:hypothetical protein